MYQGVGRPVLRGKKVVKGQPITLLSLKPLPRETPCPKRLCCLSVFQLLVGKYWLLKGGSQDSPAGPGLYLGSAGV